MRKLIAGMKMSVDRKIEGPKGYADWVEEWADDYGLMPQIDACLLGGALKQQPGKDIYLVGGARTTASLIDAGLVDELRLIVYPLIAGEGKALFATTEHRRGLELRKVQQLQDGRVSLIHRCEMSSMAPATPSCCNDKKERNDDRPLSGQVRPPSLPQEGKQNIIVEHHQIERPQTALVPSQKLLTRSDYDGTEL